MFEITILSIFRQSEGYLARYIQQVKGAFHESGGKCHAVWLEGDSKDRTFEILSQEKEDLEKEGHKVTLIKFDLEKNLWPSIDHSERWAQLTTCWNKCMEYLLPCKIAVCVESDLIWEPDVISKVIQKLDSIHQVVCPMLMIENSEKIFNLSLFYDTWAFSRGNKNFRNTWPYWSKDHRLLDEPQLLELSTCGGMIVATYEIQKQGKWDPTCCVRKFPKEIRLFMDKTLKIYHPAPQQWQKLSQYAIFFMKLKAIIRKRLQLILEKIG